MASERGGFCGALRRQRVWLACGLVAFVPLAALLSGGRETWLDVGQPLSPTFAVVLALLTLAAWLFGPAVGFADRRGELPGRTRWLILAAIVGVGAALRMAWLETVPGSVDGDSTLNGYVSVMLFEELVQGHYTPVLERWARGNETGFLYLLGGFLKAFGISVFNLRLLATLAGTATIAAVYALGRRLMDTHVGLLAAAIVALSPWHIMVSRLPKRPILTPLFLALTLLFLVQALRSPSLRRGLWSLVACGVALGIGLHGYEAFRLVPLVVLVSLLVFRFSRRQFGRGLVELGLIGAACGVVVAPIVLFVVNNPHDYFHHVVSASVGAASEPTATVLVEMAGNAFRALATFIDAIPRLPSLDQRHTAPLLGVSVLFLLGLMALARRGEDGRRSGRPETRAILLSAVAVMSLVLLLTEYNESPRRYLGLLVPYALLAAAAARGLFEAVARRTGARPARGLAVVAALAVTVPLVSSLSALAGPKDGDEDLAIRRVLRWAAAMAETHEVYLAPSVRDRVQLVQFYLHHPRIHRLHTGEPLPHRITKRDLVLIGRDERWGARLRRLYGQGVRRLRLEPAVHNGGFRAHRLWSASVVRRRISTAKLRGARDAALLVPRPGRYQFKTGASTPAAGLTLGKRVVPISSDRPATVGLEAGVYRLRLGPGRPGGAILWRPPAAAGFCPLPGGLLWRLSDAELRPAPDIGDNSRDWRPPEAFGPYSPNMDPGAFNIQDVLGFEGAIYLVDSTLESVRVWNNASRKWRVLPLKRSQNQSFAAFWFVDGRERRMYNRGTLSVRLAVSRERIYLLDREASVVQMFDHDGMHSGQLNRRFRRPGDIAASGDGVFVSDCADRAVYRWPLPGTGPGRAIIRNVAPLALDASNGRLALADGATHQLVWLALPSGEVVRRVTVGRVAGPTTLSLNRSGMALLTQRINDTHHHQPDRVLVLSPRGEAVAQDRDPERLGRMVSDHHLGVIQTSHLFDSGKLLIFGECLGLTFERREPVAR